MPLSPPATPPLRQREAEFCGVKRNYKHNHAPQKRHFSGAWHTCPPFSDFHLKEEGGGTTSHSCRFGKVKANNLTPSDTFQTFNRSAARIPAHVAEESDGTTDVLKKKDPPSKKKKTYASHKSGTVNN